MCWTHVQGFAQLMIDIITFGLIKWTILYVKSSKTQLK